ncbi:MAG: glycosyltransferase family 2 protein [Pirellulaceae bacterium]
MNTVGLISKPQASVTDDTVGCVVRENSLARLSLVIPCRNELESIPQLRSRIGELVEAVVDQGIDFDLIFVDDGSTDNTADSLEQQFSDMPQTVVIQHPTNRGITAAVMTGMRAAQTEWVVVLDADCTYDPLQVLNLLPSLVDDEYDLVLGSPYHPSGKVLNVPRWRLWISSIASQIYRRLLKTKVYCYTGCFRAYRRSAFDDIKLQHSGFVGMTELVWQSERAGNRIKEIPATLDVRRYGQSKLRLLSVIRTHLQFMMKIFTSRLIGR